MLFWCASSLYPLHSRQQTTRLSPDISSEMHNLRVCWLKRSSSSEENSNSRVDADLENQSAQVAALAAAGGNIEVVVNSSAHNVDERILVHLSHGNLCLNTNDLHTVSFIRTF